MEIIYILILAPAYTLRNWGINLKTDTGLMLKA